MVDACVFSKIDLTYGYHQIRVKAEDIQKITFRTRYGHYEYFVISFSVTNVIYEHDFSLVLDKFVVVFIDDILIYSKSKDNHAEHLKIVLSILKEKQLHVKLSKC